MASSLYYLLTYLPSLPALGEPLSDMNVIQKIREEGEIQLTLVADLLELESKIEAIADNHYILNQANYIPELPEWLPEELQVKLMSFSTTEESVWLTEVYSAWFAIIAEMASKTGSQLLGIWAKWEWSLRSMLMATRLLEAGSTKDEAEAVLPVFVKDGDADAFNHQDLINVWRNTENPMDAEMVLDQARIDFLKDKFSSYSFDIDELIAYMIELRIHTRYARLSLEEGRKILEEVTAL